MAALILASLFCSSSSLDLSLTFLNVVDAFIFALPFSSSSIELLYSLISSFCLLVFSFSSLFL